MSENERDSERVRETMEEEIWRLSFEAQYVSSAWDHLYQKMDRIDKGLRFFTGLMATSTIASWSIWEQVGWLWKFFSICSAAAAVASAVWDLRSKKKEVMKANCGWEKVQLQYDSLLSDLTSGEDLDSIRERKRGIEKELLPLAALELVPSMVSDRIRKHCYNEVLRSHGLQE